MSMFMIVLTLVAVGLAGYSLVYTFRIAGQEKRLKGDFDTDIPDVVKEHPFIRNPVFLSILIGSILIIFFIAYWSIRYLY
ncbi:hypothetical protein [Bacillus sp. KH172YL63]|uniref:hypothetical protein n=1 Tax=Bacillus sp. KH172YL63 TaxID=2709784 RepID=UPI0013E4B8B9|nr:hypothetical protein [Bacillus sp. KH172YL63]BCB03165.1 hypothetical protein KH172YL63_12980 [Bacillus sp. KH172YL63]